MKNIIRSLCVVFLFGSCTQSDNSKAKLPEVKPSEKVATFAGGCFWSIQEGFLELKGVITATSGYAGGRTESPTYEEVGTGQTGHAEAVQVVYDPQIISFGQLLEAFFYMHDPTQLNRQGPDIGTSYRSIAFYRTADEKQKIENAILKFNRAKLYSEQVVTQLIPFEAFYPAENYHQNYYRTHPNDIYITNVCGPKLEKLRASLPNLLKDEFK